MPYLGNPPHIQKQMLEALGLSDHAELFTSVPEPLRLERPLDLPHMISEMELDQHVRSLASRNRPATAMASFLGAGCYDHFIPAAVELLSARGESVTPYTPYQAEASQGTLQTLYEFQTMIAELYGMEIANASLYDGTSAAAEAVLMALAITGRKRVIVSQTVHPETIECLKTYLVNSDVELVMLPYREGRIDLEIVANVLDDRTACVLFQVPNVFGIIEEADALVEMIHAIGALAVVSANPMSLGLLRPPGEYDADIVVGEGQPLGIPMNAGGPYLGLMATRKDFVRRVPGRLVARTVDRRDAECYCLTLQTREQHIRREKATSNICTNEGLMTVRAMLYLALVGAEGMVEVARLCSAKAHYLAQRLDEIDGFTVRYKGPFFNEFVLHCDEPADRVLVRLHKYGILGGVPLKRFYPQMENRILVAVTEKRTRAELDAYVAAVQS